MLYRRTADWSAGRRLTGLLDRSRLACVMLGAACCAALAQPPDSPDEQNAAEVTAEQAYADFVHYIMIGRFDIAASEGKRLLDHPDATPDNMLTYADKFANSREAMLRVAGHEELGPLVAEVVRRIHQGELNVRKDPERIKRSIQGLLGPPRQELYSIQRLAESGEYAVPWIVDALSDAKNKAAFARIVEVLPKIGKGALNPLVQALATPDEAARRMIIESLGRIGYTQALPYLKRIVERSETPDHIRLATVRAIGQIVAQNPGSSAGLSAAEAFVALGEAYYYNRPAVRADPREEEANVWYWRDAFLTPVVVPQRIFDEIMCMRCCEKAMKLEPNSSAAVSLWLAANFRREAQLEMDPTAETDDPRAGLDQTRPPAFPRAIYFARSAGAKYNLMVLARAVKDRDAAVALGSIAALSSTAGPHNVELPPDSLSPLADALTFPDLLVRIRAALVLGGILPRSGFAGADRVVPTLAEALAQTGQANVVVVEPDESNRNRIQGMLREDGAAVVAEGDLLTALNRARSELPTVDAIFLASDVSAPRLGEALAQLRADYSFAHLPVVLLVKPRQRGLARTLAMGDHRIGAVLADAPKTTIVRQWQAVAARVGKTPLSGDEALELALQAADVLRAIAVSNSPVYKFEQAETALVNALGYPLEELRIKAASVLALAKSSAAQTALAEVALNDRQTETLRVAAFGSLAESARTHGNLLPQEVVDRLLDQAMHADDMVIRVNASKALGALNLPSNRSSEIIGAYYGG